MPGAFVHAFDTDPQAQEICRPTASANNVTARLSASGHCSLSLLDTILPRGRSPVVVCDCEGGEMELIDPRRVPSLRTITLVVECHDFIDATITPTLIKRLEPTHTHTLIGIREGAHDPNDIPILPLWNSLDRWLAICEYRPCTMHWLVARPK